MLNLRKGKKIYFITGVTVTKVNTEFNKLHQLIFLEKFKSCLPSKIKTHLDEKRAEDLHQATIWADDYTYHTPYPSYFVQCGKLYRPHWAIPQEVP